MTSQKQKAALAITGAVALASGAYALGTQVDDGSAAASNTPRPAFAGGHHRGPGGPGFGLDRLADRLGVDEDKLREALQDIRKNLPKPEERRDDFAAELAKELGTTEAKVQAALDRLRKKFEQQASERRDALAEELAKRLNLDVSKVKEALKTPGFPFRRP